MLLRHLRVVDPESSHDGATVDLRIERGTIAEVGKAGQLRQRKTEVVHELKGCIATPGWIDCVYPADPGFEPKESIEALARAAHFGGITRLVCFPNVDPVADQARSLQALRARTEAFSVKFHFLGALSQGTEGREMADLYDLHRSGARGFSDGYQPTENSGLLLRVMQYLQSFGGLAVIQAEDGSLRGEIGVNEGIAATRQGLHGTPELAERIAVARALEVLEYAGGRLHLQPISSPEVVNAVGRFRSDNRTSALSCGVYLPYLLLTDDTLSDFDAVYKVHPPLRDDVSREKLLAALRRGEIDILATGHRAQGPEEKDLEFTLAEPGMLGLQTFLPLAWQWVEANQIEAHTLIRAVSYNPRRIFGLPTATLTEGNPFEATIFDPNKEWTFTEKQLFSRARNSPWLGQSFSVQSVPGIGTF